MLSISFDTAPSSSDVPQAVYRRVKARLAKVYPDIEWRKDNNRLHADWNPSGDLPTVVRDIRARTIEALGRDDGAFVMVSVRATRGTRARPYDLGTIGTPDTITESYDLG